MSYEDFKRWHAEYLASPEFAEVRTFVWKRDRSTCRQCGCKCGEGTIGDVHHTAGYRWVLMPDNEDADFEKECHFCHLVCRACHRRTHGLPAEELDPDQVAALHDVLGY